MSPGAMGHICKQLFSCLLYLVLGLALWPNLYSSESFILLFILQVRVRVRVRARARVKVRVRVRDRV